MKTKKIRIKYKHQFDEHVRLYRKVVFNMDTVEVVWPHGIVVFLPNGEPDDDSVH